MSRSVLFETAQAVIQSYNTWTLEAIMAPRAPNCVHQILPSSLDRPLLNNEQYQAYFLPMMAAFANFHVVAKNTVIDEGAKQVVLHASSTAVTDLGDYKNEYMIVLHMTADGTKVERFQEFVDSRVSVEMMSKLRAHLAARSNKEDF